MYNSDVLVQRYSCYKPRMRSFLAVVLALVAARVDAQAPPRIAIPAGPPPSVRAIWVLQSDNKLLMFDGTQFKNWRGTVLPSEARKNPEAISVSRAGYVLFAYPPDGRTALRRFWSSNVYAPELVEPGRSVRPEVAASMSCRPRLICTSAATASACSGLSTVNNASLETAISPAMRVSWHGQPIS